ncbi:hypothetical protein [Kitasatospora sp. NPDC056731]|uniref:hypothetical protein n=1 Tax=Kitasatospora sp. NPDC056731 TaxID=3155422 RepID=UPI00343DD112
MAGTIATISGTMLRPGVSRNRRLYTPEIIAAAVDTMRQRMADPDGLPIVMRTHHDAGDDSARIVGRLTDVTTEKDGSARYKAVLYDTNHGRDIAALVVPAKGEAPALRSVSIHGYWSGPVRRVTHEGQQVTTADGLEIDALDFTATPGVLGASVTSASYTPDAPAAGESAGGRMPISEHAEALLESLHEEAPPIRSRAGVRRAVREANAPAFRLHVMERAKALGHTDLIPSHWMEDGSMQETTRYSDVREHYPDGPGGQAGFCVDAYNGPLNITLRACGIDPAELRTITAAAMQAACDALAAMDPDMDADIDLAGAPNADTDGDSPAKATPASKETAGQRPEPVAEGTAKPPADHLTYADAVALNAAHKRGLLQPGTVITPAVAAEAHALTQTTLPGQGEAAPTTQEEEPAVSEPTTQETAAPARSLTDADITALGTIIGAALQEQLAPVATALKESRKKSKDKAAKETKAPEGAVAETAATPAQADAVDERDALKTALRNELREELLREFGTPGRRGYRVGESDRPAEPTSDEMWAGRADTILGTFGITPKPAA